MDDEFGAGFSRRQVLKRVGAGTAIAWSAPVVLSVGARAAAGTPVGCGGATCAVCDVASLGCGSGFDCACHPTTEADCFCAGQLACVDSPPCTTSADCTAPGARCTQNCCAGGPSCQTPCVPGRKGPAVPAGEGANG